MKRKYAKTLSGEKATAFECTKRKCKWVGAQSEKQDRKDSNGWTTHVCPKCGNEEFYGLL